MEQKFVSQEVFDARMDVFEEKINSVVREVMDMKQELKNIADIQRQVVEHGKDIQSAHTEIGHNRERLRKLEENQAKIVWAVVSAILMAIVQFVISGGLIKR